VTLFAGTLVGCGTACLGSTMLAGALLVTAWLDTSGGSSSLSGLEQILVALQILVGGGLFGLVFAAVPGMLAGVLLAAGLRWKVGRGAVPLALTATAGAGLGLLAGAMVIAFVFGLRVDRPWLEQTGGFAAAVVVTGAAMGAGGALALRRILSARRWR
jgi:hypothetical protein